MSECKHKWRILMVTPNSATAQIQIICRVCKEHLLRQNAEAMLNEHAALKRKNDDAWKVIKAAFSLEMLLDALGSRHSLRDAGPDLDSLTKTLEPFKKRLEALLTGEEPE